ncbi:hypothetical protein V497_08388 [Pseudogymnoascus sp. VKM F-4516 (FW-969)]|nr:hypothetical protein V497_08388 [Pseudogymnoascus sp. VKM F-4516 (FW-969)]
MLRRPDNLLISIHKHRIIARILHRRLAQRTLIHEDLELLLRVPVPRRVSREEKIHLLERALVGFRIQSPHHRQGDGIRNTEDIQRLLANSLKHNRAEKREPSIPNRPPHNTKRIPLRANSKREDLSRVQPGDSEPRSAEDGGEDENHRRASCAEGGGAGGFTSGGGLETDGAEAAAEEHGDALGDGTPVEGFAAADAVECEDADEGGELGGC